MLKYLISFLGFLSFKRQTGVHSLHFSWAALELDKNTELNGCKHAKPYSGLSNAAFKREFNFFFFVARLKTNFPYTNHCTNRGYLLSPVTVQRNICGENASVKVSIEIEGFQLPVTFTCDGRFIVPKPSCFALVRKKMFNMLVLFF